MNEYVCLGNKIFKEKDVHGIWRTRVRQFWSPVRKVRGRHDGELFSIAIGIVAVIFDSHLAAKEAMEMLRNALSLMLR